MPITDYCNNPHQTRYSTDMQFKYWDRVDIVGTTWPKDYTYDSYYNTARFYDWCRGTVVWFSYNYNSNLTDEPYEIIYQIELDDCIGWDWYAYVYWNNLVSIDDIYEDEDCDEAEDEEEEEEEGLIEPLTIEDFINRTREIAVEEQHRHYVWGDDDKFRWSTFMIQAMNLAMQQLLQEKEEKKNG